MSSFKDSETKQYDDNIAKYSKKAVEVNNFVDSISAKVKKYWRKLET